MAKSKKSLPNDVGNFQKELEQLALKYRSSGVFVPRDINIEQISCACFVAFKRNPDRFAPVIFDGKWSFPDSHPTAGEIRLVAVVECRKNLWLIGRQLSGLFAMKIQTA